jgi:hypothetical protein
MVRAKESAEAILVIRMIRFGVVTVPPYTARHRRPPRRHTCLTTGRRDYNVGPPSLYIGWGSCRSRCESRCRFLVD